MNLVVMALVLVLASLLQVTLPMFDFMGQARVPFVLGVVLYYSLDRDTVWMLLVAVLAGFLHDALSGVPLGLTSLTYLGIGAVVSRGRGTVTREHLFPHALIGAASAAGIVVVHFVIMRLTGGIMYPFGWCLLKALWSGLMGLWCVPLVFVFAAWLDGACGNILVQENVTGIE